MRRVEWRSKEKGQKEKGGKSRESGEDRKNMIDNMMAW